MVVPAPPAVPVIRPERTTVTLITSYLILIFTFNIISEVTGQP